MKKWQKVWLIFLIIYSVLHLIRDTMQDLGFQNLLTTSLVKHPSPTLPGVIWSTWNTYFIAVIEIILSIITIKNNKFYPIGFITVIIAIATIIVWSYYWFFL